MLVYAHSIKMCTQSKIKYDQLYYTHTHAARRTKQSSALMRVKVAHDRRTRGDSIILGFHRPRIPQKTYAHTHIRARGAMVKCAIQAQ